MKVILLFCVFTLAACHDGLDQLQNKTVRDSAGNYYRVTMGIGDTVFLTPVDANEWCKK